MRVMIFAFCIVGCLPVSAGATVLAHCGASQGRAYFDVEHKWVDDGIRNGAFEFVADDKGNPNVHFIDVTGGRTDAAADGGKVSFSFIDPARTEFGMVVVYEETGVVETYNVITSKTGKRNVFWTSNKSNAAPLAKVSAFVANCR